MIKDIEKRIDEINKKFRFGNTGHLDRGDIEYLLFLVKKKQLLLDFIDSAVSEMQRPLYGTESGISKKILIETLLSRYLYYKTYPSELQAFMEALKEE